MSYPIEKMIYSCYVLDEDKAIQALWNIVTTVFNVTRTDIESFSKDQKNGTVDARHTMMFLARNIFKMTLKDTADLCSRKEHTSVIFAQKKIKGFYDVGDPVLEKIESIKKKLYDEIKII